MNRRPGQIEVVTEVGYCPSCGRTRNLRREEHHLGQLVRTIVTCETCHRTLSSSIGVASEPVKAEPEPLPASQPAPAPAASAMTPTAKAPVPVARQAAPAKKPAAKKPAAKKPAAKKPAATKPAAKKPAAKRPAGKPTSTATRKPTRRK
jgi:hypothetical protein